MFSSCRNAVLSLAGENGVSSHIVDDCISKINHTSNTFEILNPSGKLWTQLNTMIVFKKVDGRIPDARLLKPKQDRKSRTQAHEEDVWTNQSDIWDSSGYETSEDDYDDDVWGEVVPPQRGSSSSSGFSPPPPSLPLPFARLSSFGEGGGRGETRGKGGWNEIDDIDEYLSTIYDGYDGEFESMLEDGVAVVLLNGDFIPPTNATFSTEINEHITSLPGSSSITYNSIMSRLSVSEDIRSVVWILTTPDDRMYAGSVPPESFRIV